VSIADPFSTGINF